ncbi:MAG: hypothetical protein QXW80_02825 [Candidatus Micrarchaeia archaeon]
MSEIEQLKQLVSKLRERDASLIDTLERINDSFFGSKEELHKIVTKLVQVRNSSKGYERDFYDFVLFNLLNALNKVEGAMRHTFEVIEAYQFRGSYWRDIEEVVTNE